MNTECSVNRIVEATARPPSWGVPRWPTMAVSVSTYSGSAMSAPKAGIATRAISRSYGLRRRAGAVAMRPTVNRFGDGLPGPIPRGAPPWGGRTLATMSERPASDPSESPVDIKPRSRDVTDGYERAPARAMLRAIGMTDDDWGKAQVGVCSSWNEVTPCNLPLGRLARRSKEGVIAAGGFPIEFTTIAVSDGISMGHEGMRASLVSREVIADSVETVMHAERLDAMVTLAGCDKSLPGMLMAAARLNVPSVFVYGGSILPGHWNGQALDVVSVFEAVGAHATGAISREDLTNVERNACPTDGSCAGMFTANTIASVAATTTRSRVVAR